MKTKSFFTSLLVVLLAFSCQEDTLLDPAISSDVLQLKNETNSEGDLKTIQFESPSLEGNLIGLPALRNVNIYLPKSYDSSPEKRFPVIYFLHGMPAWENMLISPDPFEAFFELAMLQARVDFPQQGFKSWVDDLMESGDMKECIIVMPDARTLFGPCLFQNSEILGNFEDYIVKDLVDYMDSHFRTIPHFNWRAISGHCAGGYGALNIAMRHPHVFRYVAALSPAHFTEQHFQQIASYSAYEDLMWQQQGVPAGPVPYNPEGLFKFATNTSYAICQFWLPDFNNPPYYCELPYTFINGIPVIDSGLMNKIDNQNLLAQTRQNEKGLRQLKTVYFDCGENDDLGMYPVNVMLHQQLEAMHIKHEFETYNGTHISNLYERLAKVWGNLSNDFPEKD